MPNHLAEAPVEMMTLSALITCLPSSISTSFLSPLKSTAVTQPVRTSVSKRLAWFSRSTIMAVPLMPSGYPGKLSTSVVSVSWPPGCMP